VPGAIKTFLTFQELFPTEPPNHVFPFVVVW
jgi:hypothetical protein